MEVHVDPFVVVYLVALESLYLRALAVLRRRRVRLPRAQVGAWHAALVLSALGLLSPLGHLGEEALSAHMAQHLLIADLAAPLLLIGLRSPMLVFFLPRPVLVAAARARRIRTAFRTVRRPLVAIPLYVVVLYGWHLGPAFESAVRHGPVHALQHASFVAAGVLVWWAVLEPKRRRVPGELWKLGHVLGARVSGMFLGMAFVILRVPVYTGVYGSGERAFGLPPIADQQLAGALMLGLDFFLVLLAMAFLFHRAGQDHDRALREAERARRGEVRTAPS